MVSLIQAGISTATGNTCNRYICSASVFPSVFVGQVRLFVVSYVLNVIQQITTSHRH